MPDATSNIWPTDLIRARYATEPTDEERAAAHAAAIAGIDTDHDTVVLFDDRGTDTISVVLTRSQHHGWTQHQTESRRGDNTWGPEYTTGGLGELMLLWSMTGLVPLRESDAVRASAQDMKQLRVGGVIVVDYVFAVADGIIVREPGLWRGLWDEYHDLSAVERSTKKRSILWQAPAGQTPKPVPTPTALVDLLALADQEIDAAEVSLRAVQTVISDIARRAVRDIIADIYPEARTVVLHRDGRGQRIHLLDNHKKRFADLPASDSPALSRYIGLIAAHYVFPKTRDRLQIHRHFS